MWSQNPPAMSSAPEHRDPPAAPAVLRARHVGDGGGTASSGPRRSPIPGQADHWEAAPEGVGTDSDGEPEGGAAFERNGWPAWLGISIATAGSETPWPTSSEGRIVPAVLVLSGLAIFGPLTASRASWFVEASAGATTKPASPRLPDVVGDVLVEEGDPGAGRLPDNVRAVTQRATRECANGRRSRRRRGTTTASPSRAGAGRGRGRRSGCARDACPSRAHPRRRAGRARGETPDRSAAARPRDAGSRRRSRACCGCGPGASIPPHVSPRNTWPHSGHTRGGASGHSGAICGEILA